jgi:methyl-accepting chemotaxis protein
MSHRSDDTLGDLKRMERDKRILEQLFDRLSVLESRMEKLSNRKSTGSSRSTENVQEIVSKISALRDMIDKIEVEMEQLDSRINDIESLRFKHRS